MLKKRALVPGSLTSGSWMWSYPGREPHAKIGYVANMIDIEDALITLDYSANGQPMRYDVRLVYTVPRFGGRRWWFMCPLRPRNGGPCAERRCCRPVASRNGGDPVQLRMVSKEGHIALALAKPEYATSRDIFDVSGLLFLYKLNETKAFFALELGGPSRTYDAKHLPAARPRFAFMCEQARRDWSAFLRAIKQIPNSSSRRSSNRRRFIGDISSGTRVLVWAAHFQHEPY